MFDAPIDFPKGKSGREPSFNQEDFFDDCPVCQAQKRAISEGRELTAEELMVAMGEAAKNGISGGLWPGSNPASRS